MWGTQNVFFRRQKCKTKNLNVLRLKVKRWFMTCTPVYVASDSHPSYLIVLYVKKSLTHDN